MKVIELNNPSKILKVYCYTPISKPLNGSLPRSNTSHLLRLYPVEYTYKNGKKKKHLKQEYRIPQEFLNRNEIFEIFSLL